MIYLGEGTVDKRISVAYDDNANSNIYVGIFNLVDCFWKNIETEVKSLSNHFQTYF